MSYFFNPHARIEHLEHVAYYESRQPGLGARYLTSFEAAMSKICARAVNSDVEVLVIAPHRRRPDYWFNRIE